MTKKKSIRNKGEKYPASFTYLRVLLIYANCPNKFIPFDDVDSYFKEKLRFERRERSILKAVRLLLERGWLELHKNIKAETDNNKPLCKIKGSIGLFNSMTKEYQKLRQTYEEQGAKYPKRCERYRDYYKASKTQYKKIYEMFNNETDGQKKQEYEEQYKKCEKKYIHCVKEYKSCQKNYRRYKKEVLDCDLLIQWFSTVFAEKWAFERINKIYSFKLTKEEKNIILNIISCSPIALGIWRKCDLNMLKESTKKLLSYFKINVGQYEDITTYLKTLKGNQTHLSDATKIFILAYIIDDIQGKIQYGGLGRMLEHWRDKSKAEEMSWRWSESTE